MRRRLLAALLLASGVASWAWADTLPRLRTVPSLGWSLDEVVDLTAAGTVTATTVATTGLICTSTDKLTTDSSGNFICSTDVSGGGAAHNILSATHSDSVAGAVARGALVYGNSTPAWDKLTVGAANTVLKSDGTDVSWTGTPTVTSLTASNTVTGPAISNSGQLLLSGLTASRYLKLDANKVVVTTGSPIPVADGGTGASTFTTNGVLYGNTQSAVQVTAQGAANTVLTANAGAPVFSASPTVTSLTATGTVTGAVVSATGALQVGSDYIYDITGSGLSISGGALTASGGSNHNMLSATHSDSVAAAATRGDLIVANSSPAWARFAVGSSNTVLTANGTDPAWSATPTVTSLTATNTVTGATVAATAVLSLPNGTNPNVDATGSAALDTTNNVYLVGSSARILVFSDKNRICKTFENLVDVDDAMPLDTAELAYNVQTASCKTSGFTTQPTITLVTDSNTTMTGAPTCTAMGAAPAWTSITANNTVTGVGVTLQFNTTNTPAPTSGTQTIICFSRTELRT